MIADAGALSASGYQGSSSTLALMKNFTDDSDYFVWEAMTSWLASSCNSFIFEDRMPNAGLKSMMLDLTSLKHISLGGHSTTATD